MSLVFSSLKIFRTIYYKIIYFFLCIDVYILLSILYFFDFPQNKYIEKLFIQLQHFLVKIDYYFYDFYAKNYKSNNQFCYISILFLVFFFIIWCFFDKITSVLVFVSLFIFLVFIYLRVINFPFHFLRTLFFVDCLYNVFFAKISELKTKSKLTDKFKSLYIIFVTFMYVIEKRNTELINEGGRTYTTGISLFSLEDFKSNILL